MLVFGQQAGNGHVIPGSRAPGAGSWPVGRGNGHRKNVRHTLGGRYSANVHGAEVLAGIAAHRRSIGKGRRLQHWVLHDAAVRGGIRSGRADHVGAGAPNLLKLSWRHIRSIVGSDGSPELLAASLVNGTKAVCVDYLWLVNNLSVDAQAIVRFGRLSRSHGPRLRKENLVLATTRRRANRSGPDVWAATGIAQR